MDVGLFLGLVAGISFFVALLILMNTSILANLDIPNLLRELWQTYFGRDESLPDDDELNPPLNKKSG